MRVADLIGTRREVYSISDETTVHDAARYIRERQVRAVGVCDHEGVLIGVVSHSDIAALMVKAAYRDPERPARSISCKSIPKSRPDAAANLGAAGVIGLALRLRLQNLGPREEGRSGVRKVGYAAACGFVRRQKRPVGTLDLPGACSVHKFLVSRVEETLGYAS